MHDDRGAIVAGVAVCLADADALCIGDLNFVVVARLSVQFD